MEKYFDYIIPILAFSLLTAGWFAVQLLAKKIGTKNLINKCGNCCGACDKEKVKSEK